MNTLVGERDRQRERASVSEREIVYCVKLFLNY